MEMFTYTKPTEVPEAITASAAANTAQQGADIRFLAGGTTLFDLMKLNVERPTQIIDIKRLPLDKIEKLADGRIKIGALVRNADLAHHPIIVASYPVLSKALLAGASAQLRNMATTAGNLLQRTRCMYFRNVALPCNKRAPGSGCGAIDGENRSLAILGTSKHCIATNPSDMNVALTALDATIHIQNNKGEHEVAMRDFFLLPGTTPQRENILEPGDLITAVSIPALPKNTAQVYLKLRDRASYEFALSSAAIVAGMVNNRFAFIRIALGGVGTKPWRALDAENVLREQTADPKNFHEAAVAALKDAVPQSQNGFKIELAKRCIIHALTTATKPA